MSEFLIQLLNPVILAPLSALLLLTPPSLFAAEDHHTASSAVELGKVAWLRDLDEALKIAAREDKPVFILFQEVPGCSTCRNYGAGPLSHPLITEAIDSLFVPVAVFNNREGADRKALQRFKESAWNNPVVRIVDNQGKDIAKRLAGNYTESGLGGSMREALDHVEKPVPPYLRFLDEELHATTHGTEEAVFAIAVSGPAKRSSARSAGLWAPRPDFFSVKK